MNNGGVGFADDLQIAPQALLNYSFFIIHNSLFITCGANRKSWRTYENIQTTLPH